MSERLGTPEVEVYGKIFINRLQGNTLHFFPKEKLLIGGDIDE